MKALLTRSVLFASLLAMSFVNHAQNLHKSWNTLLGEHVVTINKGHSTQVDYAAIKNKQHELKSYLSSLSAVTQTEFDRWTHAKQLAFLINAYNAWTVELILTEYPKITSIKDLGNFFSSPWSKTFVSLLEKPIALMI